MHQNDEPRFLEALSALAALFSRDLDDAAIALYWDAVSGLTLEDFQQAVKKAAKTCTRFPPPAELCDLVGGRRSPELQAAESWAATLAQWDGKPYAGSPGEVGKRVVELMGGNFELTHRNRDWLENWGRKQFVELYCGLIETQERGGGLVPELTGAGRKQIEQTTGRSVASLVGGFDGD